MGNFSRFFRSKLCTPLRGERQATQEIVAKDAKDISLNVEVKIMEDILNNHKYLYYIAYGIYSIGENQIVRCPTYEAQISYNKFNEAVVAIGKDRIQNNEQLSEEEMRTLAFYFDNMQGYARELIINPEGEMDIRKFVGQLSENEKSAATDQMRLYDACFRILGRGVTHYFSR